MKSTRRTNPQALHGRVSVGVTGHRNLKETPELSARIQSVFNQILDKFRRADHPEPPAAPLELSVLTALAEGADRLVAKEALKRQDSIARLKVVLPFEPAAYEGDFSGPASVQEFYDLYSLDPAPVVINHPVVAGSSSTHSSGSAVREHTSAYYEAGEYILRHCDVLIALWDGEEARGEGGTSRIVEMARRRKLPVFIIQIPALAIKAERIDKLAPPNKILRRRT